MLKIVELDKKSYEIYDKKIYETEIEPYLPEKIFDIHAHIGKKSMVDKITDDRLQERWELEVITSLTYEKFLEAFKCLFPKKKFKALFFGYPFKEINLLKVNKYIGQTIDNIDFYGLITASPYDNYKYLEDLVKKYSYIGFKPYPDLCDKDNDTYNISDYVSKEMLEVANEYGLIILLHLKSKNGEQGINCEDYIKELLVNCEKYPNIKFVIPHFGRAHCPKIAQEGLKKVIKYLGKDKLYFDTSSCTSIESFIIFLENYSIDKILFGNDFGISLIRAKFYCKEGRDRVLVPRNNYEWYKNLDNFDRNLTLFAYESLLAMVKAFKKLNLDKKDIEKIMYHNSEKLVREACKI